MGTKTLSSILNGTLTFFVLHCNTMFSFYYMIASLVDFSHFFLFSYSRFSSSVMKMHFLLMSYVHPMHVSLTQVTSKLDPLDTPFLCYYVKCKRHSDLECILEVIISSSKIQREMYIWCFYSLYFNHVRHVTFQAMLESNNHYSCKLFCILTGSQNVQTKPI